MQIDDNNEFAGLIYQRNSLLSEKFNDEMITLMDMHPTELADKLLKSVEDWSPKDIKEHGSMALLMYLALRKSDVFEDETWKIIHEKFLEAREMSYVRDGDE